MRAVVRWFWLVVVPFGLASILWASAPRVLFDTFHRSEYEAARTAEITHVACRTTFFFVMSHCEVGYTLGASPRGLTVTDHQFGWATTGPYRLLQHRDDDSRVVTDVALANTGSRLAFVVVVGLITLALFARLGGVVAGAIPWPTRRRDRMVRHREEPRL